MPTALGLRTPNVKGVGGGVKMLHECAMCIGFKKQDWILKNGALQGYVQGKTEGLSSNTWIYTIYVNIHIHWTAAEYLRYNIYLYTLYNMFNEYHN